MQSGLITSSLPLPGDGFPQNTYTAIKPISGHCWPFKDRLGAEPLKQFLDDENKVLAAKTAAEVRLSLNQSPSQSSRHLLSAQSKIIMPPAMWCAAYTVWCRERDA